MTGREGASRQRPRDTAALRITRRAFLAGGAITLLSLLGCGAQGASGTNAGTTSASSVVRFGTLGLSGRLHESGIIAQKEGFIEEELAKAGFTPSYQAYAQAGPAVNEAFASGEVDAAIYSDMVSVTAMSKRLPVKIVASSNSRYEYGVLAGSASSIRSVADLKGKRVVAAFGTSAYQYLIKTLTEAGLGLADIQIVNGTAADAPNMVAGGQADALALPLAQTYTIEEKGAGSVIATSVGNDALSSTHALAVRTEFAEKNPQAVVALVRSLQRAYEFAREDVDKARQDLTDETYSAETVAKVYPDASFPSLNPQITDTVRTKYADLLQFMKDNKLVDGSTSIDGLFDTSYYDQAVSA